MSEHDQTDAIEEPIELGDAVLDKLTSQLRAIDSTIMEVQSTGTIGQDDVASVESFVPGLLTDNYPSGGYTLERSSQNVAIALEEMDTKAKILIGAIVAAAIALIIKIFSWIFGKEEEAGGGGGGGGKDEVKKDFEDQKKKMQAISDKYNAQEKVVQTLAKEVAEAGSSTNKNLHTNIDKSTSERLEKVTLGLKFDYDCTDQAKIDEHIMRVQNAVLDQLNEQLSDIVIKDIMRVRWVDFMLKFKNKYISEISSRIEMLAKTLIDAYPNTIVDVKKDQVLHDYYQDMLRTLRATDYITSTITHEDDPKPIIQGMVASVKEGISLGGTRKNVSRRFQDYQHVDITSVQGLDKFMTEMEQSVVMLRMEFTRDIKTGQLIEKIRDSFKQIHKKATEIDKKEITTPHLEDKSLLIANRRKEFNSQMDALSKHTKHFAEIYHLMRHIRDALKRDYNNITNALHRIHESKHVILLANAEALRNLKQQAKDKK